MNRLHNKPAYPLGQVVVMAFAEERSAITSFQNLLTVLIIKPQANFPIAY